MTETVVLLPFDGERLVFTLPEITAARLRAAELGLNFRASTGTQTAQSANGAEPWLTSQQMAQLTNIGDTWWEQAARSGRVPSIRAGKALRFRLSEVTKYLRSRTESKSADLSIRPSAPPINSR